MYGPDEDDRVEPTTRPSEAWFDAGQAWLVVVTTSLLATALVWGITSPLFP